MSRWALPKEHHHSSNGFPAHKQIKFVEQQQQEWLTFPMSVQESDNDLDYYNYYRLPTHTNLHLHGACPSGSSEFAGTVLWVRVLPLV